MLNRNQYPTRRTGRRMATNALTANNVRYDSTSRSAEARILRILRTNDIDATRYQALQISRVLDSSASAHEIVTEFYLLGGRI